MTKWSFRQRCWEVVSCLINTLLYTLTLQKLCVHQEAEGATAFCTWELSEGHTQWGLLWRTPWKLSQGKGSPLIPTRPECSAAWQQVWLSKQVPLPFFLVHVYGSAPETEKTTAACKGRRFPIEKEVASPPPQMKVSHLLREDLVTKVFSTWAKK